MVSPTAFLLQPFRSAWGQRALLRELARREIQATFAESMLGVTWLVLQPLLSLAVYAAVFGGILRQGGGMDFVCRLFTGMIVYHAFSDPVGRAAKLVVSRPNFVTKVAFPLDLLPWPVVALAAVHAGISVVLLVLLQVAFVGVPAWTVVLLPLVLVPVLLLGLATSWVLSSLGVYLRDTSELVRVGLQLLFFLSPVVWPVPADGWVRTCALANPLAVAMETARAMIAGSAPPDPGWLGGFAIGTALLLGAGHAFFRRTKDGFADVL